MSHVSSEKYSKFFLMSVKGKEFLERREGRKPRAYPDSGGMWSIGIGHLITQSERTSGKIRIGSEFVKYSGGLTSDQINDLFMQDLKKHEDVVSLALYESNYKEWRQHQVDALVSFSYNVGSNAFKNSTLAKYLKSGELVNIPGQLERWVYDNGVKVEGLVNRRNFEISLFKSGIYS